MDMDENGKKKLDRREDKYESVKASEERREVNTRDGKKASQACWTLIRHSDFIKIYPRRGDLGQES